MDTVTDVNGRTIHVNDAVRHVNAPAAGTGTVVAVAPYGHPAASARRDHATSGGATGPGGNVRVWVRWPFHPSAGGPVVADYDGSTLAVDNG